MSSLLPHHYTLWIAMCWSFWRWGSIISIWGMLAIVHLASFLNMFQADGAIHSGFWGSTSSDGHHGPNPFHWDPSGSETRRYTNGQHINVTEYQNLHGYVEPRSHVHDAKEECCGTGGRSEVPSSSTSRESHHDCVGLKFKFRQWAWLRQSCLASTSKLVQQPFQTVTMTVTTVGKSDSLPTSLGHSSFTLCACDLGSPVTPALQHQYTPPGHQTLYKKCRL